MICYRSQEASQSDDSIERTDNITILDDVSLLDDPVVNTINMDHVKQQLEALVSVLINRVSFVFMYLSLNRFIYEDCENH